MSRWDTWFRRIGQLAAGGGRVIAFYLGARIFELAPKDSHDRVWLYFAALLLMGLSGAAALEGAVDLLSDLLAFLRQRERQPPPSGGPDGSSPASSGSGSQSSGPGSPSQ